MDDADLWLDRFLRTPRDKRTAMCEALAWKLKLRGAEWKKRLAKISEWRSDVTEDLAVGLFVAFVPPAAREPIIGKLVPLIKHLQEVATTDDEHAAHHAGLRRALERIVTSTYEDGEPREHPFADLDLTPILMQLGHLSNATQKLLEDDVQDEAAFRKRWELEDGEWQLIVQEAVHDGRTLSAHEVAEEQRRRMHARGQSSVLDGSFARRLLNRLFRATTSEGPSPPSPSAG